MVGDGRDELAFKALGDPDALERRGVDGLHVGLLVGRVRVELDVELAVAVGDGVRAELAGTGERFGGRGDRAGLRVDGLDGSAGEDVELAIYHQRRGRGAADLDGPGLDGLVLGDGRFRGGDAVVCLISAEAGPFAGDGLARVDGGDGAARGSEADVDEERTASELHLCQRAGLGDVAAAGDTVGVGVACAAEEGIDALGVGQDGGPGLIDDGDGGVGGGGGEGDGGGLDAVDGDREGLAADHDVEAVLPCHGDVLRRAGRAANRHGVRREGRDGGDGDGGGGVGQVELVAGLGLRDALGGIRDLDGEAGKLGDDDDVDQLGLAAEGHRQRLCAAGEGGGGEGPAEGVIRAGGGLRQGRTADGAGGLLAGIRPVEEGQSGLGVGGEGGGRDGDGLFAVLPVCDGVGGAALLHGEGTEAAGLRGGGDGDGIGRGGGLVFRGDGVGHGRREVLRACGRIGRAGAAGEGRGEARQGRAVGQDEGDGLRRLVDLRLTAIDGKAEELGLITLGGLSFAGDVVAVCPGLLRGRGAESDLEEGLWLFVGVQLVDVGLRVDVGGGDELRLDRAGVADAVGLTADDGVGVGDEAAADDGVLAAEIAGDRAAVGAGGGGLAGDGTGGVAVVDLGVAAAEDAADVLHVCGIGGVDIAEIAAGLDEDGAVLIVDLACHAADVAAASDLAGVDTADDLGLHAERVVRVDLTNETAGIVAVSPVVGRSGFCIGDRAGVGAPADLHIGRAADEAARAGKTAIRHIRRVDGHAAVIAAACDLVLCYVAPTAVCTGHDTAREAVERVIGTALHFIRRLAGDRSLVDAVFECTTVLQIQGEGTDPLAGGEAA